MGAFRKPLVAGQVHFVFVCWKEESHGVILSRPHFDLVERFGRARKTATKWHELLAMLDSDAREFIRCFMQTDPYTPAPWDEIESIRDDVWILHSDEFPLLQCATESFALYGRMFPAVEGISETTTEYGEQLPFYPKQKFFAMKEILESAGHMNEYRMLPGKQRLYAY